MVEIMVSLEEMTNEELIQEYRKGNREAYEVLFEKNKNFPLFITDKFAVYYSTLEKDDLVSIASIGMIKSVETFQLDRGFKFTTYASRCMINELSNFVKTHSKKKKRMTVVSLDISQEDSDETLANFIVEDSNIPSTDTLYARDILELFNLCGTQDELFLLEQRFYLNKSLDEIGGYLNISREAVRIREKKLLKRLNIIKNQLDRYNLSYLKDAYLGAITGIKPGEITQSDFLYLCLHYPEFNSGHYKKLLKAKKSFIDNNSTRFKKGELDEMLATPTYDKDAENFALFHGLR